MDMPDDLDPLNIFERAQHAHDETLHRHDEMRAREEVQRSAHAAQMADMEAMIERQKARIRRLDELVPPPQEPPSPPVPAPPPAPEAIRAEVRAEMACTPADLERWIGRDSYPTWFHAAYADLAQRLTRVDERLDDLETSMSLLHTKMEMIIGQLAAVERQERQERGDA